MKRHVMWLVPVLACGGKADERGDDGSVSMTSLTGTSITGASATDATETDASGTGNSSNSASGDSTAASSADGGPKFDVHIEGFCAMRDAGVYCSDNRAIECDGAGMEVDQEDCTPDLCLPGTGCVVCLDGQFTCMSNKVMQCDTNGVAHWVTVETCDPASGQGCDLATGSCQPLAPVGTDVPTGEYFQFADFHTGATVFTGGYDVDSYDDKLYVLNYSNAIDVYQVTLMDSDGDGQLEPNQHPNNPDAMGPIEERTIAFVETIPTFGTPSISSSELLALDDRLYIGGSQLTENVLGVGTSVVTSPPGWLGWFAHVGYDDVHGVWYASNEGNRRVMQYDATDNSWGIAFYYPPLAGDHMDGMEVVTQPSTGIPYVYVSDMTSDFIGQYRLDPEQGWVQENLFSYFGTAGVVVEGMGFGALNHFWATGGESVYELGGGDLAEFTDPPG